MIRSVQNAVETAREAQQGWSSEGSDGGSPMSPVGRPQSKGTGYCSGQSLNPDIPWRSEKFAQTSKDRAIKFGKDSRSKTAYMYNKEEPQREIQA